MKCEKKLYFSHIIGAGIFKCYYNNHDLTKRTRVTINNEQFFKTGDLARYNAHGELVHVGRIDFQIKIHGQRVNINEIENIVIDWSSNVISSCLVVKFPQVNQDSLIAYLVSKNTKLDIASLRDYCREHLCQYMVPSYFIVLDKFPLNANGKVDRKQLPLPLSSDILTTKSIKNNEKPMSKLEDEVCRLWSSLLGLDLVPRHANLFALGGSSLLFMQLFNYYQTHLSTNKQLSVTDFLINPTIAEHVRHLTDADTKMANTWQPLYMIEGMQERDVYLYTYKIGKNIFQRDNVDFLNCINNEFYAKQYGP